MNRRTLLKLLTGLPFVSILLDVRNAKATEPLAGKLPSRRVRPGDADWPTPASWIELKEQVGGNLFPGSSPVEECKSAGADSEVCKTLLKNLQNPYFIGDNPGLTQTSGWVDGWTTAASSWVVAAHSSSDVVAAVNFAREKRLRLVVRGGAHSYKGTSSASDSLMLWTRAMNEISLHDAFVPTGCESTQAPQSAVSIGAGAMWIDVYTAVTTKGGRFVQGGGCTTVGVVGLISGGGFGSFSKRYGMAAASLLQAEIVTADGTVRTVNESRDPDLFWAIKGGGGGSFGVVTKITLKTHELPSHLGGALVEINAASDGAFRHLVERFVAFYHESLFNPQWGEHVSLQPNNSMNIGMVVHGMTEDEAKKTWKPFLDWVNNSPAEYTIKNSFIGAMEARNWWDVDWRKKNLARSVISDPRSGAPENHFYWDGNQGEVCVYLHGYESIWLPKSLLQTSEQKKLCESLFAASRLWNVELHFNKGLAGAPPEALEAARKTAMNPLVLDAFALAIIAGGKQSMPGFPGHEPNLKAAREDAQDIANAMKVLRKVVPEVGAYVNESSYFEKSWQESFWGATNYKKLRDVKAKYDPESLFFVHQGVGNESWSADGFTKANDN